VRVGRPARPAVTGRAIALGTVVVLLLVLLASPLNRYFGSRGDVNSAAQQLQRDRARLAELQQQQRQWGDPGFIERQARTRLQYAMPGDTTYIVVDRGARNQIDRTVTQPSTSTDDGAWNTKLWDSVQRAGDAA
jgi:cell division protein FtsB